VLDKLITGDGTKKDAFAAKKDVKESSADRDLLTGDGTKKGESAAKDLITGDSAKKGASAAEDLSPGDGTKKGAFAANEHVKEASAPKDLITGDDAKKDKFAVLDEDLITGDGTKQGDSAAKVLITRDGPKKAAATQLQHAGQVGKHRAGCLRLILSHPQAWVDLAGTKDGCVNNTGSEDKFAIGDIFSEDEYNFGFKPGLSAMKSAKMGLPRGRTSSGIASGEDDWPGSARTS
jgi:hypothetical protein